MLGSTLTCSALTYTTLFPTTENPISESGSWLNGAATGLDWHNCKVISSGKACGTETSGDNDFADSTAILTGSYGRTQTVSAVVYVDANSNTGFQEVELRILSSISSHSCTGYEIVFSCSTDNTKWYVQIVRWNGVVSDFTYVNNSDTTHHVVNGDTVSATVDGNGLIKAFINGTLIVSGTDTTFTSGNMGIGFYLAGTVDPTKYGFTQFSATDGINPVTSFSPAPFGR